MFTHLHVHSEYSLLDGLSRIPDLVSRAKELGMEHLALTDHGVLYGAIEFYQACRAAGIVPIIGCELYIAQEDHRSRAPSEKNSFHLTVLARDFTGYRNLVQLVTAAHVDGFYYRPRVDKALLEKHCQGLIVLSGCPNGELPTLLKEGRLAEARRVARWFRERFPDYFIEVQEHGDPEFADLHRQLVAFAREEGLPLVATNDTHYTRREDAASQDLLLCIQTNTVVEDPKRLKLYGDSFYLKSPQEMAELFRDLPEAIANTQRIAESCHLELPFGELNIPEVALPPGLSPDEYLAQLTWEGAAQRYPDLSEPVRRRIEYELEVIRQTQFATYFLVVHDIVRYARSRGILCGVRGSAAASVVLYCLGMTELDPIEYRLVFERFLNIERREVPDIDLDFQDDRRDEVLRYTVEKYGPERVAHIVTFGTLRPRAAVRDVGRALGLPYATVDRVARLVPMHPDMTWERAFQENEELRLLAREDETIRGLVEAARPLEGIVRHASTHASGVVISRQPLTELVPLQRPVRGDEEGLLMTQYPMESLAALGLLKMDLLGLDNLTILDRTRALVRQTLGVDVDPHRIPLDDTKAFELIGNGETRGLFQLEGAGMTRWAKELKPSSLKEIAALIALYRPGPMQHIPAYIRAKQGLEPIQYPHPALAPILEETYGVIVYQDQVLLIAQAFAGYTLGQADILRKAMGKKIPEIMREERRRFIQGAMAKGFSEEEGARIFDLIEPFAGYAFNKAHSVGYALLSYQTAYFKAHYPAQFMAALLDVYREQTNKVAGAIAECHRLGIPVLPPDINRSDVGFSLEQHEDGWAIRFGLAAVKNVGESAARSLVAARGERPFGSLEDFCRRIDPRQINKRVLESLIKVGALDGFGPRGALLAAADRLLSLAQQEQRRRETGQTTMFDLFGQEVPVPIAGFDLSNEDVSVAVKLAWEKELTGVHLSGSPLQRAWADLASAVTTLCGEITEEMHGQTVVVAGIVNHVRRLSTRDGRSFLSVTLEDLEGSLEVTVWPEVYQRTEPLWVSGAIVLVQGKVRARADQVQLVCENARAYQPGDEDRGDEAYFAPVEAPLNNGPVPPAPARPRRLSLRLPVSGDRERDIQRMRQLLALLQEHPGTTEVRIAVPNGGKPVWLDPGIGVDADEALYQRLVAFLGEDNVQAERGG